MSISEAKKAERGQRMVATQIIQNSIDDLKNITKVDLVVVDVEGMMVAKTSDRISFDADMIIAFAASPAGSQTVAGYHYSKVYDEGDPVYVVLCGDSTEEIMIGRVAVSNIQSLIVAYKERYDRNSFFQNLIFQRIIS